MKKNLSQLIKIAEKIKIEYNTNVEMISDRNSSSFFIINERKLPKKTNNLRIGEAILDI